MPNLVLYQPDIPQNLGAIMRLCACFASPLHIIEPCGFPLDDKRIRKAGMDYIQHVDLVRHSSWEAFEQYRAGQGGELVLLTTKGSKPLYEVAFASDDWLIFGRESAGVPEDVHAAASKRIIIPMQNEMRSMNLATSVAIVLSEVQRQLVYI